MGWFESFGDFSRVDGADFHATKRPRMAFSAVQRHYGPDLLRRNCTAHQVPHAHQVVGRAGKREDPIDFQRSAMPHFAHQRNGLQPAKTFFDALPFLLAEGIAPCRVVRLSMALPPRRPRFCATCGVTRMFRHSRTKSAVSKPLSPPTVTRPFSGMSCSISSAA